MSAQDLNPKQATAPVQDADMIAPPRRLLVFQGHWWRMLPAWRERLAANGITADTSWMRWGRGELVSRSPSTRCFRLRLDDGTSVYFKRYVYAPRKLLEFWLRPSKATVEGFGFACLRRLGIPTLEVLALGELRRFGMLRGACVVTRGIDSTQTLEVFARDTWWPLPAAERRRVYREITQRLVTQVRRAHGAGFFHHDLKWRNILIRQDAQGYTPVWIDCPRAEQRRWRRRRGVIVDLSGLARLGMSYCSLYDRYRFLRAYLGPGADPREVKALFRQVQAHLQRRPPKILPLPPGR